MVIYTKFQWGNHKSSIPASYNKKGFSNVNHKKKLSYKSTNTQGLASGIHWLGRLVGFCINRVLMRNSVGLSIALACLWLRGGKILGVEDKELAQELYVIPHGIARC